MSEEEVVLKFIGYCFWTVNIFAICNTAETIVRKVIEYLERRDDWYAKK